VGMNYRLTELQAAVAVAQVEQLEERNRIRNGNAWFLIDSLPFTPQRIERDCEGVFRPQVPAPRARRAGAPTRGGGHSGRRWLHASPANEIAAEVDERTAVDVQLRPGEMSLHHVDIIHGSNPNHSPRARTGFIVRYTTPAMVRSVTPVLVARGRDVTHLDVSRSIPGDDFESSMHAYQASRRST
jgi:hypothetical protein